MIKNKIKKYFQETFRKENQERGLALSTTIILGLLAVGTGIAAYAYYSPGFFGDLGSMSLRAIMGLLLWVATALYNIAKGLFSMIYSSETINRPITGDATVIHGWSIVRDFANMFIVLGFVVIGIATILRLREYEAQKLLPKLIIVAILINFSLLFCGILIDATNITMKYFIQVSGPSSITDRYDSIVLNPQISANLQKEIGTGNVNDSGKMYEFVQANTSLAIFIGIAAMIFFIYGIVLLFRYVALMCLVILAPLAFVCYVFPATQPIFNKWWSQFMQWAIIGVPTSFFLYLGGQMMSHYIDNASIVGTSGPTLAFWIPTAFLFFGYTLIFQTSAIGAAGAIGLATGAMGFAYGATKAGGAGLGRLAANATGATRAGRYIGDAATSVGERFGLVARGTLAQRQTGRQEEVQKRTALWTDAQRLSSATGRAVTQNQREEKLSNIKWALENGKVKDVKQKENLLNYYTARAPKGKDVVKEFSKTDHELAAHDTKRVREYMTDHAGVSEADAKKAVVVEQLESNWGSMNPAQRRSVKTEYLTPEFIKGKSAGDMRAFRTAPKATREHLRKMAEPGGALHAHLNDLVMDKTGAAIPQDKQDVPAVRSARGLINEFLSDHFKT
jgi:hypothetical protein